MAYLGECISIFVAFSWTAAALSSEVASRRLGVFVMNVWRMALALLFSAFLLYVATGAALPAYAGWKTWGWLLASGVVGYFFGDWCLFNSYLNMGARYGQLFMTLAPAFTAFFAWLMLGQTLGAKSLIAMAVTMSGIAISVFTRQEQHFSLGISTKGVLFGLGAALGQGMGLVLSKIGLDSYTSDVPKEAIGDIEMYLPFGSNLIRCVAGLACFSLWLMAMNLRKPKQERQTMAKSIHDRRGMMAMLIAVVTGPFIGVAFSLMAVQYTAAGIASTLMATTPILILLPSYWLFHQRITLRNVVGAVISVIGASLFFL